MRLAPMTVSPYQPLSPSGYVENETPEFCGMMTAVTPVIYEPFELSNVKMCPLWAFCLPSN